MDKKIKTDIDLKNLWFEFFQSHGFKRIDSASVIPENDPTTLFNTAGMQPIVPYLLGEKHPAGNKICDVQRCIRTNDIDEVGDGVHLTLFEMLGNWYLGDCPKEEMIKLSYEFLTSPKYLGIPKNRLAITIFAGNDTIKRDEVAYKTWKDCGIENIYYLKDNWWALGSGVGPCGPDSEMFYDTGKPKCCPTCNPSCDCGKYIEIWNDVFMQYKVEKEGDKPVLLARPNIDTGMGLERTICVINEAKSVYEIGTLRRVIDFIGTKAKTKIDESEKATRSYRIICDHIRSATFIIGDSNGVLPSNVGQGYILRRFIRRAVNHAKNIGFDVRYFDDIVDIYVDVYGKDYLDIANNRQKIKEELKKEVDKFAKAIEEGFKEFEKVLLGIQKHKEFAQKSGEVVKNVISGKAAFRLFDTFGFPLELTKELALERGYSVDEKTFQDCLAEHRQKSKVISVGTFKGGLADDSYETAKLHTATHLLLAGLKKMFGEQVVQKGSNITSERLRFDFNVDHKLTAEEIKTLENFVNDAISRELDVTCEVLSLEEARKSGAYGVFDNKYGDQVKVYTIGDVDRQICGGPHAKNTRDLHHLKIIKEESCSSGIRRIKAILD